MVHAVTFYVRSVEVVGSGEVLGLRKHMLAEEVVACVINGQV